MLLLQRRWVAGHLLVLFLVSAFVGLGIWQLARNSHKHQLVGRERTAYARPAPDVGTIAAGASDRTRVEARGTFDGTHETVLRNQVRGGDVGIDVVTPLRLADGTAVLVDRGWVRASAGNGVTTDPPARGTAVVHGLIRRSSPFAPGDTVDHLADGRLAVPRVDITAIAATVPYRLRALWIEAQDIRPLAHGNAPALPEPPPPDPVNHLQYALEWFSFALIGIVGWPIALQRLARRRYAVTSSQSASAMSTVPITSRSKRVGRRASRP